MPAQASHSPAIEASPDTAQAAVAGGALLLDIREAHERLAGAPLGALASGPDVEAHLRRHRSEGDAVFYLLCATGARSLKLAASLRAQGYAGAVSVKGGFAAWTKSGLPAEFPAGLGHAEASRYARHLVLPGVGPGGQRKLLDSSILLIGAGGLGSPAGQYLAAAGVGRLGIVDFDLVERSNLQRQVVHDDAAVGCAKSESAAASLAALNPDIEILPIKARLDRDNVESLLEGWDVVVDGSDNFPTRYLANDACLRLELPLVYGAVMRFEGQVGVFWPAANPGVNPCYRCLFPEPPAARDAPNCATAGVLGVLPGIVGTLQATEALKLLLGIGEPLTGALLRIDALTMSFSRSRLRADPGCRWCAPGVDFPGYPDYEAFCSAQ